MRKHLFALTVLIAAFCLAHASHGQTSKSQPPATDPNLLANDTNVSPDSSKKTDGKSISQEATEEAKRFYRLGVKYGRAGLFRQAAQLFERAIQLKPNYADAYYGLGHAYFDLGRWQEALQSLEQAVRINPKDKEARAMLDEAYLMSQKETKVPSPTEKETAAGVPVSLHAPTNSSLNKSGGAPARNETDLTRVYRVGAGDVLDVRLSDASTSQSTLFTVTPSGFLEHPNLTAPFPVSGLTVDEIRSRLGHDLKRRAVNENPKVLVGVREYLSHAVLVSGLVKEPGTKLLRREAIPLYVVIADAQPLTDADRVTLMRYETGEALNIELSKPSEMNVLVRSGDVITLHPKPEQFFYIGGEVKSAGEKPFRAGLTLTQAILAAGGLARKSKEAQLARESGDGFLSVTRYKLKDIDSGKLADPVIQPGDRITVVH